MKLGIAGTIGWRNIWRNRLRTLLTLLAIAFACSILVFFISMQHSSYDTSINATVSVFYGHLQVQREGFLGKPQMRKTLDEVDALLELVRDTPDVTAASPRASGFALVSSERRSYGSQILGVDPETEPDISTIAGTIRSGSYFSAADAHEAVLGSLLARNLKVEVGDELTLLGQGWDGSLAATVIPVAGIFETGSNELDRGMIQIPFKTFQDVFSMSGRAHSIVVRAADLRAVQSIQKKLKSEIEPDRDASVLRWDQVVPGLKEAIDLDVASSWLFYITLVLIVTFTILNTFLMAVLERTKEFSIMLALGTKPHAISIMVLLECLFLTLVGIAAGVLLGSMLILYFGAYGFSVPGSEEMAKQWNIPATIYTKLTFRALTQGPAVLLAAALFSVLYPAAWILRLRPTEALGDR